MSEAINMLIWITLALNSQLSMDHLSEETMSIAQANNHLAVTLHKLLAEEKQNVFFSPFSLSTALAMLFFGSRNETATEMRSVLGYDIASIKDEDVTSAFSKIMSAVEKIPDDYVLASANSLLTRKDFTVKGEYKAVLSDSFKALLLEANFQNESEKVVGQINEWVKEKTHSMISNLLDSLDPSTVIVLLNAVYFKGNWLHQFRKKETFLQSFYNQGLERNSKLVDMMHLKKKFPYVEKESFKALQLPYKGDEIAMMVLLPNSKTGLQEIEEKLSYNFIQDLVQEMHETKVELALPKFRMEYSKSLKGHFKRMGMNKAFERGADFGGMSNSKQLKVSEIIHKAVLVLNEEGSEASAATDVEIMSLSSSYYPEFIVDHPFLFVIYNTKDYLIYFMGRVVEL